MKRIVLYIAALLLFPLFMHAQVVSERSSEIVKIGSKQYYMHHVKQGETLYGISKVYNVTIEDIAKLNPEVNTTGLKADMVIGIPVVAPLNEPSVQEEPNVTPVVTPVPEEPVNDGEARVVHEEEPIQESFPAIIQEEPAQSEVEAIPSAVVSPGGTYIVQAGENLYDIAKKYGVDVAAFKAMNPGLDNYPRAGAVLRVPDVKNEDEYIVHQVEESERTSSLLKKWAVSENDFMTLNPSVGSRVFVGQTVLIPIERVVWEQVAEPEPIVEEEMLEVEEMEEPINDSPIDVYYIDPSDVECNASPEFARQRYRVALMIPLYLHQVGNVTSKKSRPLAFLQFYEGFLMAADSLSRRSGLKLDLEVYDVTEDVESAQRALDQIGNHKVDLIIGPFFSRAFAEVQSYAKENSIIIVNPLTAREDVVDDNPYVVKVKPDQKAQLMQLAALVHNHYRNASVTIFSQEKDEDQDVLDEMEYLLNLSINTEVSVSNEAFLRYATEERQRLELGQRMPATIDVEGQVFATDDFLEGDANEVVFENHVRRLTYSELSSFYQQLSGVRDNVVVVYTQSNVFATQMLNRLHKTAESRRYPITLVALPDWDEFDRLLVENLLKTNAIYFDDVFVDYNSKETKIFIQKFRRKYRCEPAKLAYEGFDVGWYFLNALMRFGSGSPDCFMTYEIPLLHTQFRFIKERAEDGLENSAWSLYQYDDESAELKAVDAFDADPKTRE